MGRESQLKRITFLPPYSANVKNCYKVVIDLPACCYVLLVCYHHQTCFVFLSFLWHFWGLFYPSTNFLIIHPIVNSTYQWILILNLMNCSSFVTYCVHLSLCWRRKWVASGASLHLGHSLWILAEGQDGYFIVLLTQISLLVFSSQTYVFKGSLLPEPGFLASSLQIFAFDCSHQIAVVFLSI